MTSRVFAACVFVLLLLPVAQMITRALPLQTLTGVQVAADKPPFDVGSVAHKRFQQGAEAWFGQHYGLHDYLLKTNNQILFSAFRVANAREGIVVARGGMLLNDGYIRSTLQYAKPLDFARVVERLALIQRRLRDRGKTLIVFVTPSKSSIYPEAIPQAYFAFPHYEPGANYRNFVNLVRQADLPLVDAAQLIADTKIADAHPLFPRGGIHWNQMSGYLAAQALLTGIENATGRRIADIGVESARYDNVPDGSDRDYTDILNLWWPPLRYEVPHVTLRATRKDAFGALSGLFSGGSFSEQVLATYMRLDLFKALSYVMYNARVARYIPARADLKGIDDLNWKTEVLERDFIVLELNQAVIINDDPAKAWDGFLDDLLVHLERGS